VLEARLEQASLLKKVRFNGFLFTMR
jgi:proliferating cell nuclear antigen